MTEPGPASEDGLGDLGPGFRVKITFGDETVLETDSGQRVDPDRFVAQLGAADTIELIAGMPPTPPHAGAAIGTLILPGVGTTIGAAVGLVGPLLSGVPVTVGAVLTVWLRQRKSDVKLKITRRDGTVLEIQAKRVTDADGLMRQVNAAIEDSAGRVPAPAEPTDLGMPEQRA